MTDVERLLATRDEPVADEVDLDALAGELAGYCAALIREDALAAMRESLEATEVTAAQLATARETVRPLPHQAQFACYAAGRAPGDLVLGGLDRRRSGRRWWDGQTVRTHPIQVEGDGFTHLGQALLVGVT